MFGDGPAVEPGRAGVGAPLPQRISERVSLGALEEPLVQKEAQAVGQRRTHIVLVTLTVVVVCA